MSRAAFAFIAFVLTVVGCSSGVDPQELHAAGQSLVPSSFRIVREVESACVEGKRSPSCVTVYVASSPRSRGERVRLIEGEARSQGWSTLYRRTDARDGTGLSYERGEFKAFVNVHERSPGWRRNCRRRRGFDYVRNCADAIAVQVK